MLIDEQEQRHAGWKYRSISVKYKAGVTNAASVIRAHTRIRDPQAATTMKIMPYGAPSSAREQDDDDKGEERKGLRGEGLSGDKAGAL